MIPTVLEPLGDAVFLAEVFPWDELDFHAGVTGQRQGVIAHGVPQGFGEKAQIKAADARLMQLPFQCCRGTKLPGITMRSKQPSWPAICAA